MFSVGSQTNVSGLLINFGRSKGLIICTIQRIISWLREATSNNRDDGLMVWSIDRGAGLNRTNSRLPCGPHRQSFHLFY